MKNEWDVVCEFCLSKEPELTYFIEPGFIYSEDDGFWAVCEPCHSFIQADKPLKERARLLIERSRELRETNSASLHPDHRQILAGVGADKVGPYDPEVVIRFLMAYLDFRWEPKKDPRFPNRPDHPDFFTLSSIIQELDNKSDRIQKNTGNVKNLLDQELVKLADLPSILYFIKGRMDTLFSRARYQELLDDQDPEARMKNLAMANWLEGFLIGAYFQERRWKPTGGAKTWGIIEPGTGRGPSR